MINLLDPTHLTDEFLTLYPFNPWSRSISYLQIRIQPLKWLVSKVTNLRQSVFSWEFPGFSPISSDVVYVVYRALSQSTNHYTRHTNGPVLSLYVRVTRSIYCFPTPVTHLITTAGLPVSLVSGAVDHITIVDNLYVFTKLSDVGMSLVRYTSFSTYKHASNYILRTKSPANKWETKQSNFVFCVKCNSSASYQYSTTWPPRVQLEVGGLVCSLNTYLRRLLLPVSVYRPCHSMCISGKWWRMPRSVQ